MISLQPFLQVKSMSFSSSIRTVVKYARAFLSNRDANVAMMFGLSLIPMTIAAGAGVDLARAMVVKSSMTEALDAAALAVASTSGLSQAQANALAQNYFNANFKTDPSYGKPSALSVSISGQSATVSTHIPMSTILMSVAGINTVDVNSSSTVVWGQSKLWVSLVLDNTGSMNETDSTGTSKMTALMTATHQLLTMLQNASANPGDVEVAIIPFTLTVDVGKNYTNASWIDWTDWLAAPPGGAPPATTGPGDNCPWSSTFSCISGPANNSGPALTIPSSGLICPSAHTVDAKTGLGGHFYNGCYTSVATGNSVPVVSGKNARCTGFANCSCSGSGSSKSCNAKTFNHTWTPNSTSTWSGCIMDRNKDFDVNTAAPVDTTSKFPAENNQSCVGSVLSTLSHDWTALGSQVDHMVVNGSTNQTIGLVWGWQAMTQGDPLNAPALPANTKQFIILVSDGFNTQDRFSGDGFNRDPGTNDRMKLTCANVKAAGIVIYTVFVDLGGTQGNSTVLQNCASDAKKYFDLTTSGAIITTLNQIGQQITNVRVAQ
jgi:Flp pilus assembly protein TadG